VSKIEKMYEGKEGKFQIRLRTCVKILFLLVAPDTIKVTKKIPLLVWELFCPTKLLLFSLSLGVFSVSMAHRSPVDAVEVYS
jgi:hypothetical protein